MTQYQLLLTNFSQFVVNYRWAMFFLICFSPKSLAMKFCSKLNSENGYLYIFGIKLDWKYRLYKTKVAIPAEIPRYFPWN